jgi:hypothetical protein
MGANLAADRGKVQPLLADQRLRRGEGWVNKEIRKDPKQCGVLEPRPGSESVTSDSNQIVAQLSKHPAKRASLLNGFCRIPAVLPLCASASLEALRRPWTR